MGFGADTLEKVHKIAYIITCSENCLIKNYCRAKGKNII